MTNPTAPPEAHMMDQGWMHRTGMPGAAPGPVIAEASSSPPSLPNAGSAGSTGYDAVASLAAGNRPKRDVRWFTFPAKIHQTMPRVRPEHRRFAICFLKVIEEERAQQDATGSNMVSAFKAMVRQSVWMIGDQPATYDLLEGVSGPYGPGGWWEAIGPGGRTLVSQAYGAVNGVDDSVGEEMLANGQDGQA